MDILLIAVLIILAGFGLHGYIRGMVRMIFSLVAVFLTIGIASWITPYTAEFLRNQTPLYDSVKEKCMELVQQKAEEGMEQKAEEQEKITVFGIEVPSQVQDFFSENAVDKVDGLMRDSGVYEQLAAQIAETVIQRMAWILSFVVVVILLGILIHVLDLIAKLPVLNSINHAGGLAVGLVEGILIVWILFFVITLCQGSEFGSQMMESIGENPFLKLLYDNNIIEQLL